VKAEVGHNRILHFATHAVLDDQNPLYSYLVLAPGSDQNEDGLLEAWELMQIDLRAELAVLSACDTGRGRVAYGEGLIGMTWSLFVAGVPTTVASQWQVPSDSTARLG
jgi:CHAT domain-containing protein